MEKAETDGLAPEKLGFNEDGVYDSADYRYKTFLKLPFCVAFLWATNMIFSDESFKKLYVDWRNSVSWCFTFR